MEAIKFGTDGWRAVIAREYTMENVERLAQATAVISASSPGRIWPRSGTPPWQG